jgi:hypothetical protein
MTPNQAQRRPKKNPKRRPRERYTVSSYDGAIYCACRIAFPPPAPLAREDKESRKAQLARLTQEQKRELKTWEKAHQWAANQLRHARATEIRREAGLDAARAVLGHRSSQITEVYAEIDVGKAAEIMIRIG